MSDVYYLSGFINLFNIIPAFVVPVFTNLTDRVNCVQYIEDDKIVLDMFTNFSDSFYLTKVKFYSSFDSEYKRINLEKNNYFRKIWMMNEDIKFYDLNEPIFAFHTESNIFYGKIHSFISFINNYETDDEYLKEEIHDFKENIAKFKNSGSGKDICLKDSKFEMKFNFSEIFTNPYRITVPERITVPKIVSSHKFELEKQNLAEYDCDFNPAIWVSDDNSIIDLDFRKSELLKRLDQQLRNTQCFSDEYKKLIGRIYELLFNNPNYKASYFPDSYKFIDTEE